MVLSYVYYSTNEDFNFVDDEIYHETGLHGFDIGFDSNDVPVLNSVKGFGCFWDAENYSDTPEKFASWVENNLQYLDKTDPNATKLEDFTELLEGIRKIL